MKKNLIIISLSVLSTLIVLFAGIFIYANSGAYDISQLSPHNGLTHALINMTKHSSINKRMKDIVVPGNLKDSAIIITGFKHYNEMCTGCHSAPGQSANESAEGLYPKPPQLFKYVKSDDAQEFFWIIKNGIKMTSMPAYAPTQDADKIWAITAFLTQKLGTMKPAEYSSWMKKYGGSGDE